jgi:hypothetical protein
VQGWIDSLRWNTRNEVQNPLCMAMIKGFSGFGSEGVLHSNRCGKKKKTPEGSTCIRCCFYTLKLIMGRRQSSCYASLHCKQVHLEVE